MTSQEIDWGEFCDGDPLDTGLFVLFMDLQLRLGCREKGPYGVCQYIHLDFLFGLIMTNKEGGIGVQ